MKSTEWLRIAVVVFLSLIAASCGSNSSTLPDSGTNTMPALSGSVTAAGVGLPGVALSLNTGATLNTDANGFFSFGGLSKGTYTITPSKSGYTFSPSSSTQTINDADVTGILFTATTVSVPTFSLSGTVSFSGSGKQGVLLTLSTTPSRTTATNGSGAYAFPGLENGAYTVTPSKPGYTFTPASTAASINSADLTSVDFTAAIASGVNKFDGTYSGTWTNTDSGNNANGTFTITAANGTLSNISVTITSGGFGILFTSGTISPTGVISGSGDASPVPSCSGALGTFSGQITVDAAGNASMNMTYSRTASGSCAAESGSMTATRI